MTQAVPAALPPREYEVLYILRPDITKEKAEKVAKRVEEVIGREGGTLTLVENWGRRVMAYEIQHQKRGNYVFINYLGDGALVAELERNFRLLDEVMRFQTVKVSDNPGEVEVDASRIVFEAQDPPEGGDEMDLTLEQELGLVQTPRHLRRDDDMDDMDMDDDDEGDD